MPIGENKVLSFIKKQTDKQTKKPQTKKTILKRKRKKKGAVFNNVSTWKGINTKEQDFKNSGMWIKMRKSRSYMKQQEI